MASFLVHPQSCPSEKTELDFWSVPETQVSIERKTVTEYRPVAALAGETPMIEFLIPAAADVYYDLDETHLHVKAKVKLIKTEGAVSNEVPINAAARALFSPVQNFMHSIFQRVDLEINGKLVTDTSQHYPYRALLETLFNYDEHAMATHLQGVGWHRDTDFGVSAERSKFVADDGSVDLFGRLRLDLFNQGRLLLGGMEMKLTLQPHRPSFYFICGANHSVKVEFERVVLYMTEVKLTSPQLSRQEERLKKSAAKYPITRVSVRQFVVPKDVTSVPLDSVWSGQLPRRMHMVMVDNAAENGSFTTNPFKFDHNKVNYVKCIVNGESFPATPMTPDFEKDNVKREYWELFHSLEQFHQRPLLSITPKEFANGYTIFSWNLTPDFTDGCSYHWNVLKRGTCRVELRFADKLANVITVLFIGEFDNVIEVDADRTVTCDY